MITHIRMKNFKSWEDSGEVKLAPLTGFFGTNSSGKSSLLQMLLLLKQTIGTDEILFFGDDNSLINLGDFREVIHGHKSESPLGLELAGEFKHTHFPQEERVNSFAFESMIRAERQKSIVDRLSYGYRSRRKPEIIYDQGSVFFPSSYKEERNQRKIELNTCYGKTACGPASSKSIEVLNKYASTFEDLFSQVYYLGPTRVPPQRYYHWEGDFPETPGQWGGQTIDALLSARIDQRMTPYKGANVSIESRISAWLQKMELAYTFEFARTGPRDDKNYEFRIQRSPKSIKVTLADIGYGVSQFLPILVMSYYVPIGSTLILEEPGTHLHPGAQAAIADLLIEVITERNLQVLIESHSEHLLNRLQRRVAEEEIAADQTALYFCRNEEGVSKIDKLEMDEFGNIGNWPPNFFGDEIGDLFAMTEAQRERQKRAEE